MIHVPALALLLCALPSCGRALSGDTPQFGANATSVRNGWVTVVPQEFHGAINNPLKGFRDHKKDGCGLLDRKYIKWNEIEVCADDAVDRIIAHANEITKDKGRRFEELNVKLVPRVFLDWNGEMGSAKGPKQHWPADLHAFDHDSPAFQARLKRLVEKLAEAWDDDPRIFAVQMDLIDDYDESDREVPADAAKAAIYCAPISPRMIRCRRSLKTGQDRSHQNQPLAQALSRGRGGRPRAWQTSCKWL